MIVTTHLLHPAHASTVAIPSCTGLEVPQPVKHLVKLPLTSYMVQSQSGSSTVQFTSILT
jgi:hypothetical protein